MGQTFSYYLYFEEDSKILLSEINNFEYKSHQLQEIIFDKFKVLKEISKISVNFKEDVLEKDNYFTKQNNFRFTFPVFEYKFKIDELIKEQLLSPINNLFKISDNYFKENQDDKELNKLMEGIIVKCKTAKVSITNQDWDLLFFLIHKVIQDILNNFLPKQYFSKKINILELSKEIINIENQLKKGFVEIPLNLSGIITPEYLKLELYSFSYKYINILYQSASVKNYINDLLEKNKGVCGVSSLNGTDNIFWLQNHEMLIYEDNIEHVINKIIQENNANTLK